MILAENLTALNKKFSTVLDFFNKNPQYHNGPFYISESKAGLPTMYTELSGNKGFIHSQYDPKHEAESWADKFDLSMRYKQLIVYGFGLGYHIEALVKRFPKAQVTVIEPYPNIFYQSMRHRNVDELIIKHIHKIIFITEQKTVDSVLVEMVGQLKENVLLGVLPSYERIFNEETRKFVGKMSKAIKLTHNSLRTRRAYKNLWVINSTANFIKVIQTPNILKEKKLCFQDKPVLVVAAGPSLQEEIVNIKHIKDNKLAYIFAVGSANKSLILNGIYPDVVVSFDPNTNNHEVFDEIVDMKIDSIPLLFGSTVGFHTLDIYPGPKLHMLIDQDPVSRYYLEDIVEITEIIADAPSVAVTALEVLAKAGANPIILVGQNLAYKNNQYYAQGISYHNRPTELTKQELSEIYTVESVDGGEVITDDRQTYARYQMELFIRHFTNTEFINTTKGGAKIHGTSFMELTDVIRDRLSTPVVEDNWLSTEEQSYDFGVVLSKALEMKSEQELLESQYLEAADLLRKLQLHLDRRERTKVAGLITKFDAAMQRFMNNKFHRVFLMPSLKTESDILLKFIPDILNETDVISKAQMVVERFGKYLYDCKKLTGNMFSLYLAFHNELAKIINSNEMKDGAYANERDGVLEQ